MFLKKAISLTFMILQSDTYHDCEKNVLHIAMLFLHLLLIHAVYPESKT